MKTHEIVMLTIIGFIIDLFLLPALLIICMIGWLHELYRSSLKGKYQQMDTPNLRINAFSLGLRLIFAAANPFSGLTRQASRTTQWQPEYPFGMPRWWPIGPGKLVDLGQIVLMHSVLPLKAAHPNIEVPNSKGQVHKGNHHA